jgi:hypothetical protein
MGAQEGPDLAGGGPPGRVGYHLVIEGISGDLVVISRRDPGLLHARQVAASQLSPPQPRRA